MEDTLTAEWLYEKPTQKMDYHGCLTKVEALVKSKSIELEYTQNLDPFFKGDLDGKTIYIAESLPAEEKLFNLLHLSGHTIQWSVDKELREMGSHLITNPDDVLLKKLQTYEWQANCYGLALLHMTGEHGLDHWLTQKYLIDMFYLTHWYKTGEKKKEITELAKMYVFKRDLEEKAIPEFTPYPSENRRYGNGIVISF